MIVGIHQPNYLPWPGYFFKMYYSDTFIYHDVVALSRQTFVKRTKVLKDKNSNFTRWLTVPVKKHNSSTLVDSIEIDQSSNWQKKHLNKIYNAYSNAPFYSEIFPALEAHLLNTRNHDKIADMNRDLIEWIAGILGIRGKRKRSSQMTAEGKGSALNIKLVMEVEGDIYLSGVGGSKYQKLEEFELAKIQLKYQDFGAWQSKHPYNQGLKEFVPGLSIIDALMHIGPQKTVQMFEQYAEELVNEFNNA